jgi:Primase C terminal 2 (PriCT-2)
VFKEWSACDPKYVDSGEDIENRWNSFEPNKAGGVGIGTLKRAVIEAGKHWPFAPDDGDDFEFEAIEPIGEDENKKPPTNAKFDDFYAYLPQHQYVYIPTRELWPAATIDSVLGRKASVRLDRSRPLHQMTGHPGMEMVIRDHVVLGGALLPTKDAHTFNLYLPPK